MTSEGSIRTFAALTQCQCHCRLPNLTCPLGESRLGGLLNGAATSPVSRVFKEIHSLSKKPTALAAFGDVRLSKGELQRIIQNTAACEACQQNCTDILGQLEMNGELSMLIEAHESTKHDKTLQWTLTREEGIPDAFIARITLAKKKHDVPKFVHLSGYLKWQAQRHPVVVRHMKEGETLFDLLLRMEHDLQPRADHDLKSEAILKMLESYSDMLMMFFNGYYLTELFAGAANHTFQELDDCIGGLAETIDKMANTEDLAVRRTFLETFAAPHLVTLLFFFKQEAILKWVAEGYSITEKNRSLSYFVGNRGLPDVLPAITEILTALVNHRSTSQEMVDLSENFRTFFFSMLDATQRLLATDSRFGAELDRPGLDVFPPVAQNPQAMNEFLANATRYFGMKAIPEQQLATATTRFWQCALARPGPNMDLINVMVEYQDLLGGLHGCCGAIRFLFPVLERFRRSLGPLDWLLARMFDDGAGGNRVHALSTHLTCKSLAGEANAVMTHVLAPRLVAGPLEKIEAREREEKARLERAELEAKEMLDALEREDEQAKKKKLVKSKKGNHVTPAGVKSAREETVEVDTTRKGKTIAEETSNDGGTTMEKDKLNGTAEETEERKKVMETVKSNNVAMDKGESTKPLVRIESDSKEDSSNVNGTNHESIKASTAHEVTFEPAPIESDTNDEWEPAKKKKPVTGHKTVPASPITSSSSSEHWLSQTSCEVRIPGHLFGMVMGEKASKVLQMERQSGCSIKALPEERGVRTRTFLIRGPSQDIVRRGAQLVRDRADIKSVPASDNERTVTVNEPVARQLLLNKAELARRMERETQAHISVREDLKNAWIVYVASNKPDNIERAIEKIKVLESRVNGTVKAKADVGLTKNTANQMVNDSITQPVSSNGGHETTAAKMEEVKTEQPSSEQVEQPMQATTEQVENPEVLTDAKTMVSDNIEDVLVNADKSVEPPKTPEPSIVDDSKHVNGKSGDAEDLKRMQEASDADLARKLQEEAEFIPVKTPTRPAPAITRASPSRPSHTEPTAARRVVVQLDRADMQRTLISGTYRDGKMVVEVPQTLKGRLLGSLNRIQKQTSTRIDLEEESKNKMRLFTISGKESSCKEAFRLLQHELGEEKSYYLPRSAFDRAFIDNGKHLKTFEEMTKTKIMFSSVGERKVMTILGDVDGIKRCKFIFENLLVGLSPMESLAALRQQRPGSSWEVYTTATTNNGSTASAIAKKGMGGLSNSRGENSCFLNVVVQSLYHFSSFSDKMIAEEVDHPRCKALETPPGKCIVCALLNTFKALKAAEEGTFVSSVELREAVAEAFEGEKRFDLGNMEDAVEAFTAMLETLHRGIVREEPPPGRACDCLVHRSFSSFIFSGVKCSRCLTQFRANKYHSDPLLVEFAKKDQVRENVHYHSLIQLQEKYDSMVRYVPSTMIAALTEEYPSMSFEEKVKRTMEETPRSCPACDTGRNEVELIVTKLPQFVFSLGLAWASETPDYEREVLPVIDAIAPTFDLASLTAIRTTDGKEDRIVRSYPSMLRGMICFKRRHYVAYFRKRTSQDWFKFDDAMVKAVGSSWTLAKNEIKQSKFQPVVLFYEIKSPIA